MVNTYEGNECQVKSIVFFRSIKKISLISHFFHIYHGRLFTEHAHNPRVRLETITGCGYRKFRQQHLAWLEWALGKELKIGPGDPL